MPGVSEIDSNKRALFRGRVRPLNVQRPPWSVAAFHTNCSRCDECIKHCPEGILIKGDGSYPQVDFSLGGCDFCGECVDVCDSGALSKQQPLPWSLTANITQDCLAMQDIVCRSCADICNESAIIFQLKAGATATPHINAAVCNGCGFCYATCPQQAIVLKETV